MSEIRTVWKHIVPLSAKFTLSLPRGAQVLTVQRQKDDLCLWMLVQPEAASEERLFRLVATGSTFDWNPQWRYIGTCQWDDGAFVFHMFECLQAGEAVVGENT